MAGMNNYSADFYSSLEDSSNSSAATLVPILIDRFSPNSVVDFGCGGGAFPKAFIKNQILDVLGIEGEWALQFGNMSAESWLLIKDLTLPIDLQRKFDLAVCLEVAEHLPAEFARVLIKSLVDSSDRIAFSAAIPGQDGTDHINLAFPEYWARLFAEEGYFLEWDPRNTIWNNRRIAPWYRQNLLLFHKKSEQVQNYVVPESRFHPELFVEYQTATFKLNKLIRRVVKLLQRQFSRLFRKIQK